MGGSPRTAARLGGILFALSGVLALANAAAPELAPGGRVAVALVGAADAVLAVLAFALPWERWRPRATLVIVLAAFAVIAGANRYSKVPAYSYGVFFVLVFAWIGACHPPGTSVLFAPPATLAYLLPFLTAPAVHGEIARSSVVAIPVCVMVGELLSRALGRVRTAQAAAERSSADLARALKEREALDRLKTDIISIVSHELRTPLTSMGASLEILADDLLAGPGRRRAGCSPSPGPTPSGSPGSSTTCCPWTRSGRATMACGYRARDRTWSSGRSTGCGPRRTRPGCAWWSRVPRSRSRPTPTGSCRRSRS
jgi:signal transduction histidine kinase